MAPSIKARTWRAGQSQGPLIKCLGRFCWTGGFGKSEGGAEGRPADRGKGSGLQAQGWPAPPYFRKPSHAAKLQVGGTFVMEASVSAGCVVDADKDFNA